MTILRPYQKEAVEAILSAKGNALAVLPTASGKSLILAELARRINAPILILAPTKEIVEQNHEKLLSCISPEDIGIYSASCGQKNIRKYTIATIGSVYRHTEDFAHFGLIICDEAHLIGTKETSMYRSFITALNVHVIGMTATPYRLHTKAVPWHPEYWKKTRRKTFMSVTELRMLTSLPNALFDDICFNLSIKELQALGYLAPLTYYDNTLIEHANIPLNASKSDFDLESYESLITSREDGIITAIRKSVEKLGSTLVFTASVEQAIRFQQVIPRSAVVTGETKKKDREEIIKKFKTGELDVLLNWGTMTTGFDYPDLRSVICCRPTRSLGLYMQMIGRVLRIAEGKTVGSVIDFSGNVKALGHCEDVEVMKNGRDWDVKCRNQWMNKKELYKIKIEV